MKTFAAKAQDVDRQWWVIDANNQVPGRVAAKAAVLLRGKHKPIFTPNADTGDFVVIINADKVRFTGNKEERKIYTRYTGYVGNQIVETPVNIRRKHPERLLEMAVRGMIPHNRLGRQVLKKLKIYSGAEHPHEAQSPKAITA